MYVTDGWLYRCDPIFAEAAQSFRNYYSGTDQICYPSIADSKANPASALYYKPNVTYCKTDLVSDDTVNSCFDEAI